MFTFELGFNRCIWKVKFDPNMDPNFLTLIDLDVESLIEEVLGRNMYSFSWSLMQFWIWECI